MNIAKLFSAFSLMFLINFNLYSGNLIYKYKNHEPITLEILPGETFTHVNFSGIATQLENKKIIIKVRDQKGDDYQFPTDVKQLIKLHNYFSNSAAIDFLPILTLGGPLIIETIIAASAFGAGTMLTVGLVQTSGVYVLGPVVGQHFSKPIFWGLNLTDYDPFANFFETPKDAGFLGDILYFIGDFINPIPEFNKAVILDKLIFNDVLKLGSNQNKVLELKDSPIVDYLSDTAGGVINRYFFLIALIYKMSEEIDISLTAMKIEESIFRKPQH